MNLFSFSKVLFLLMFFAVTIAKSQIVVDGNIPFNNPIFLVDSLLLGSGVEASNHQFQGDPIQIGFFNGLASNIGLDSGIIMSTADIRLIQPGFVGGGVPNSNADDPDLLTVANSVPDLIGQNFNVTAVNDVVILEFDFIPTSSELSFEYVFASEEYFAWENSQYNDVFGFFISGPGIVGPYASPAGFPGGSINIATIPDSDPELPITISSVNANINANFFVNNQNLATVSNADGFTTVITAEADVICGETYHIRLSIADGSDTGLASYVLLGAGSFTSPELEVTNSLNLDSNKIFTDCGVDIDLTADISGDYDFVWNTGSTEQTITVSPGTYWVEAVDQTGCAVNSDTLVVYSQPIPEINFSSETEFCSGNSLSIETNVTSGTLPFTYNWNSGVNDSNLIVNNGGQYILTVIDSNGCTDKDTIDIVENALPEITYSPQEIVICGGVPVEVSAFGAQTYSWSPANGIDNPNGQTVNMSSQASLTYTLTGVDSNGCSSSVQVQTDSPPGFDISVIVDPVTCFGYDNGEIKVLATNGAITPVLYSIDGGQNFYNYFVFQDLEFGDYDIVVKDDLGCILSEQVTVASSESPIEVTVSSQDVLCFEDSSGLVYVESILGGNVGASGYNYNWYSDVSNNPIGTDSVLSVSSGSYYLIVSDDNNCLGTDQVIVNDPIGLDYDIVKSDVSCFGASDGAVSININGGGTGPFQFEWTNYGSSNSQSLFNLSAGSYFVEITDSFGCVVYDSIQINSPTSQLSIESSSSTASCYGALTGSIDITVSGGNSPYFYSWSSGHITPNVEQLSAGTYIVMVTDASACQLLDSVIVDENPEIFTTTSSNPATCFGYSDGSASISANGGVGTLSYLWSNQSQQEDIFGLTFGNYFVVVEDDLGCQVLDTVVVAQPNAIRILLESSNVLCNGDSTGVINSTVTGGTPFANGFYTYSWSSQNSQIGFNSPVLNNISSSPYPFQLEVVDNAGCSSSAFAFINEPEKLKLDTSDLVPAYCQNVETGQVSVYAEGGFLNSGGSYQYSWNNGVESAVLSNQNAGTYTAYVEDDNGCIDSMQVEIPLIPTFVSTIDSVPLNCFEDNSGVANIEIDGGFGPYTYSWYWQSSGSQQYVSTSNIFSKASLPAGVVSVVVVDVNGCYLSNQTQITQPQELLYSVIKDNDESCSGSQSACDGQLTFNLSGGTQPYLYEWMDLNNNLLGSTFSSSTNIQASNLCSGFYQFSVTDNKGCTATNSGNGLSSPVEIISGYEVISLIDENTYTNNILCFGDTSAFVSVLNPNSQFSYSWLLNDLPYSNGLSAIVPSGEITLRANFGACSTTSTPLLVDQPSATLINSNISHVNCFGYSSGSVEVEAINPQGLTYSWFDGSSATSIYNLSEGFYDLTIVNSLNCSTLYTFEVSEPDSLFVSPTITAVSCSNGDDGTASLLITGGVTPYQIDWQGIDPLNLQMGTYDILISDANSCLDSFELSIPESSSINASINVSGSSFSASANGGTPPYTYDWLYFGFNVGSGINFNPSQNGEYTLVVTDDNGCTDTDFQLYNTSVGLMEFGQDRFNIYPNPMQSFVTIENLIDKFEDVEFKLLDSRGRVVRSAIFKDKITIQRENLSSGLYMINLKTDLLTLKQKIIIYE